jgi:hypothetical protein
MTERLDVVLESECLAADVAAVSEVFETAGIPATVSAAYARRSAGELPWMIIIGGFTAVATWTFIKAALQRRRRTEGSRLTRADAPCQRAVCGTKGIPHPTRLSEHHDLRGSGDRVATRLPEEAYRQLFEIEEPRAPLSGLLMWDNETQAWVDALARKFRCDCRVARGERRSPGGYTQAGSGRV